MNMIKPDWRDHEYAHGPASRIHSAMKMYASDRKQPSLCVTIHYDNGDALQETYEPATTAVRYKHQGEWYEQDVDVSHKYMYKGEAISRTELVKREKAFLTNHDIPFTKITVKLEDE